MVTAMYWNFVNGHIKSHKICAFCNINCCDKIFIFTYICILSVLISSVFPNTICQWWVFKMPALADRTCRNKRNLLQCCFMLFSIFINLCLLQRDERSYYNPFHRWKMDIFWNYIFTAPTLNIHIKSIVENNKVSEAYLTKKSSFKTDFTVSGTSINMNST